MSVSTRGLAAAFVALCLAVPRTGTAQGLGLPNTPSGDWSVVQSIPAGKRIILRTKDGRTVKGTFRSATSDSVTLQNKQLTGRIPADEVQALSVLKPKNRNPVGWALTGLAAVCTLWYIPGLLRSDNVIRHVHDARDVVSATLTLATAAGILGAAVYWGFRIAPPRWTIYEAGD